MDEMREWWINVYERKDGRQLIGGSASKAEAEAWAKPKGQYREGIRSAYRYHVRLKPEGAPRRYADKHERRAWENWPVVMRANREGAKGLLGLYRSGGA